jgi:anti-sigma factor RsiW
VSGCDLDVLSLYLDGALTLPHRVQLETHLRSCPSCTRELQDMERMDLLLRSWGAIRAPVPTATHQRVMRSVDRKRRLGLLGAYGRMVPAAFGTAIAAMLVLVTVNTGFIAQNATPPTTSVPSVTPRVLVSQSQRLISARRSSAILGGYIAQSQPAPIRRINFEVN